MIVDNAPDLMMFSIAQGISDKAMDEYEKLVKKTPNTPAETAKIRAIEADIEAFEYSIADWAFIPVPIDPNLTSLQVSSIRSSTQKRVKYIGKEVQTRSTMNTVNIELITTDSGMISMLINLAEMVFNCGDSLPRFKFFSPDLIVMAGRLIGFDHSTRASDSKTVINLTVQKGSSDEESEKKKSKVEVPPIFKTVLPTVT